MANDRKKQRDSIRRDLYLQVDGLCPKCSCRLYYKKKGRYYYSFELAHIYPLNPTEEEIELLKNEERLSEDINSPDNLIALCQKCHGEFDRPRTQEEYRELLNIKKILINRFNNRDVYFAYSIESEIKKIIDILLDEDLEISSDLELSYDLLTIDDKANKSLPTLKKRDIKNDVVQYFLFVQSQFKELDKVKSGKFETIAIEVKSIYMKFKNENDSQEIIIDSLVEWLHRKTRYSSKEACRIIISFFVQNCEVLS